MKVRFEKLYSDLVTDAGDVFIVYLARVEFLGMRKAYASLEHYPSAGGRNVIQASGFSQRATKLSKGRKNLITELDLKPGRFVLTYESVTDHPWRPSGAAPHSDLLWHVVVPKADAVATWTAGGKTVEVRGQGYSDFVEMKCLPRSLNLRMLEWGRLHLKDVTMVYTSICFKSNRTWKRLGIWHEGKPMSQLREFKIRHWETHSMLTIPRGIDAAPRELKIRNERLLHQGRVLDLSRIPKTIERLIYNVITGSTREYRWFGIVRTPSDQVHSTVLHEVVEFDNRHLQQDWIQTPRSSP